MRWWLAAIVLILSVAFVRVWTSARTELSRAQTAQAAGEIDEAIEHFQYAARWYTPFSSASFDAIDALWRIGQEQEKQGKPTLALKAYRRLRGAILATRSMYSPFESRRVATNERIAQLTADEQLRLGHETIRGRSRTELVADHLKLLQDDPAPSPGWSLLVVLFFIGWVSGGFVTIYKGLDASGKTRRPAFAKWLITSLCCFAGWLVALSLA